MPPLEKLEIGVMFWAAPHALETVRSVKALGVRCGQLGVAGDYPLVGATELWKQALEAEEFTLVTVFPAFNGESYLDIPTVQRTVGFIPPGRRDEREARAREVSDFAASLGVKSIALHVGFVPEDTSDPNYVAVRDLVRRIADHAAGHGQTFALETGQETAEVLLQFLNDVGRDNVRINFDPANMILYGTGDPIEALDVLGPHLASVHAKDGDWPAKEFPGALGKERPLGQGSVGIERFIAKLKSVGYKGTIHVERETQNRDQWTKDVGTAVELLNSLR